MPNDIPQIFNFPKYTPMAHTMQITATACTIVGWRNVSCNQFIPSIH